MKKGCTQCNTKCRSLLHTIGNGVFRTISAALENSLAVHLLIITEPPPNQLSVAF
jgi:hypothetical protein